MKPMTRIVVWIVLFLIHNGGAYAITVFRADARSLSEITAAGGMWPWGGQSGGDADLLHHFEGESVSTEGSAFVSTSLALRQVVEHAASLARPNSEASFDPAFRTYIYVIRPAANFYDVTASLIHARDQETQDMQRRARIQCLLSDYAGMNEVVALHGFGVDRIILHAALTGSDLQRYYASGQLFLPQFWAPRMMPNPAYRRDYDNDRRNGSPYPVVGTPSGYVLEVHAGDAGSSIPLSTSCLGAESCPRSPNKSQSACDATGQLACDRARLTIFRRYYDKKLLQIILMISEP